MTTVVIDLENRMIACDSRITVGDVITCDDSIKCNEINSELYFLIGDEEDSFNLLDLLINKLECKKETLNANVVYTKNRDVFYCSYEDNAFCEYKIRINKAFGSGAYFAISAIDFGCTAKESVEYAITKDIFSGGKVREYKIK